MVSCSTNLIDRISVTLRDNSTDEDGFRIYRNDLAFRLFDNPNPLIGTGQTFTYPDFTATCGINYTYTATAYRQTLESSVSSTSCTGIRPCPSPTPVVFSCVITASPSSTSITTGSSYQINVTVQSQTNGTVTGISFNRSNGVSSVVTLDPYTDITSPFSTTVTCNSPGQETISIYGFQVIVPGCNTSTSVTCLAPPTPTPVPGRNGDPCTQNSQCVSNYCAGPDADRDSYYAALTTTGICRNASTNPLDCNDSNPQVNPGVTLYMPCPVSGCANVGTDTDYDFDCSGTNDVFPDINCTTSLTLTSPPYCAITTPPASLGRQRGWVGRVPDCGSSLLSSPRPLWRACAGYTSSLTCSVPPWNIYAGGCGLETSWCPAGVSYAIGDYEMNSYIYGTVVRCK